MKDDKLLEELRKAVPMSATPAPDPITEELRKAVPVPPAATPMPQPSTGQAQQYPSKLHEGLDWVFNKNPVSAFINGMEQGAREEFARMGDTLTGSDAVSAFNDRIYKPPAEGTAGSIGKSVGEGAAFAAPGAGALGLGAKGLKVMSASARANQAFKTASEIMSQISAMGMRTPTAKTIGGGLLQMAGAAATGSAAIGGIGALATGRDPVESAGWGALGGAVLGPAAGLVARAVRNYRGEMPSIENLRPDRVPLLARAYLAQAAGSRAEASRIAEALRSYGMRERKIPMTPAQVAGSPGITRADKLSSNNASTIGANADGIDVRYADQAAAIQERQRRMLGELPGTLEEQLEAARRTLNESMAPLNARVDVAPPVDVTGIRRSLDDINESARGRPDARAGTERVGRALNELGPGDFKPLREIMNVRETGNTLRAGKYQAEGGMNVRLTSKGAANLDRLMADMTGDLSSQSVAFRNWDETFKRLVGPVDELEQLNKVFKDSIDKNRIGPDGEDVMNVTRLVSEIKKLKDQPKKWNQLSDDTKGVLEMISQDMRQIFTANNMQRVAGSDTARNLAEQISPMGDTNFPSSVLSKAHRALLGYERMGTQLGNVSNEVASILADPIKLENVMRSFARQGVPHQRPTPLLPPPDRMTANPLIPFAAGLGVTRMDER